MSWSDENLDALLKDAERRRDDANEDIRAITRIKEMQARLRIQANASPAIASMHAGQGQTPQELNENLSFSSAVRIIAHRSQENFTIPMVIERLHAGGIRVPDVNPNQRVWMVLDEMRKKGFIELVEKGTGLVPNQYRAVRAAQ